MIRCFVIRADGVKESPSVEIARRAPEGTLVWVDMEDPRPEELALLTTLWAFHPLAVEDCLNRQRRAKIERYATHDFVIVQALDPHTDEPLDTIAVRIFIRANVVVTVHQKKVAPIDRAATAIHAGEMDGACSYGHLVHTILDRVIDEYMPLLDGFEEELDELEKRAATDASPAVVDGLIAIRRDLLIMKRMFLPHEEVVRRMMDRADLAEETRLYYRDVLDHLMVVGDTVSLLLDVASGALQVQMSATNDRLNRVMKYLGVISTLMLPWTVISGIFGMNFDVIPIIHHSWGFWGAVAMMMVSATTLLAWFRYKRWF